MTAHGNRSKRQGRKLVGGIACVAFLLFAVLFAVIPILWAVLTSLKSPREVALYPPTFWPQHLTFENYAGAVFNNPTYLHYLFNTAVIVIAATCLCLICASHAAHAVARYRFRGSSVLMFAMFSTIMIPGVAVVIPLYMLSVAVGIYDTVAVLILVYGAWLTPTLVWLLRGFVIVIPNELEEAGRIDGHSRLGVFYRITLPLMKPGLLAGAVLIFANIWNEFLLGYSLVQSETARVIQVGIYANLTEVGVQWGRLTAAALVAMLPVLIVYAFLQKAFVQGLSAGAVKG
ncbi:MAG TPA: carbohydrate ABC transporter permease [Pseudolabrys sp.]|nr:carbohydrate ABC transporter permease [Pseudolabrys sp.]